MATAGHGCTALSLAAALTVPVCVRSGQRAERGGGACHPRKVRRGRQKGKESQERQEGERQGLQAQEEAQEVACMEHGALIAAVCLLSFTQVTVL